MSLSNTHDYVDSASTDQLKKGTEELIESLSLERKKYHAYTIIKEVALNCTTGDCGFSQELQSKIRDALTTVEIDFLEHKSTLLGIPSIDVPEFTYNEKLQIQKVVQSKITNKSDKLCIELDELGVTYNDNTQNQTSLGLSKEDEVLLYFRKDLNAKQQLYVAKLEEFISVLEQIIKLKCEDFPEVASKKINVYEIKMKFYNLQAEMLNAKLKVSIFMETDSSLKAYEQLMKSVLEQQTECKQEIVKLERLKEKYKQVSCKQYSEILHKFLRYKTIVDKKKFLYNKIQQQENDF